MIHRTLHAAHFALLIGLLASLLLFPTPSNAQDAISAERSAPSYAIELQTRTFVPQPGIAPALQQHSPSQQRLHGLIQFNQLPSPARRAELSAAHITLHQYIPNHAWLASFPADVDLLESLPDVRWVGTLTAADKIDPLLTIDSSAATVDVRVVFFDDVADSAVAQLFAQFDAVLTGQVANTAEYFLTLPTQNLWELAGEDGIVWISAEMGDPQSLSDDATVVSGADTAQAPPYNLSGAGTQLGIWDSGVVDAHLDFSARLTVVDASSSVSQHATNVAGVMAGDGSNSTAHGGSAEQWKGTAPRSDILSFYWSNPVGKHDAAINTHGIDLSQNSWGYTSCTYHGTYRQYATNYDAITRGYYGDPIPVIFAAGNERNSAANTCGTTYGTVLGGPSSAKNVITVGAIDASGNAYVRSSWGPTTDGRLKPEVVAVGVGVKSTCLNDGYCAYNGTSQAAPSVSGAVALALESYRDQCPDSGERPLPATFRALLSHTAADLNDATSHFNAGPDFASGYGLIDIPALVDAIPDHLESAIAHGQVDSYTLTVPSGQSELRVTLAWDDVGAAYMAANPLINDLDVELIDPSGQTVYGPWQLDATAGNEATPASRPSWAISASPTRDTANVLEQILVDNPTPGNWTVRVLGTSVPEGPQTYALINRWLPTSSCLGTATSADPTTPQVAVSLNAGFVTLSWPHDNANASYEVWSSPSPYFEPGDASATLLETISTPVGSLLSATDPTALSPTTARFYVVVARNAAGDAAPYSNRVGSAMLPMQ